MAHLKNLKNEYQKVLGHDFDKIPKAVLAAIAVSLASGGGDRLEDARKTINDEWAALYKNGIVPQKPPKADK